MATVCAERSEFIKKLDHTYREGTTGVYVVNGKQVIEVLTSTKGNWTILITHPNGISCVLATGDAWIEPERNLEPIWPSF